MGEVIPGKHFTDAEAELISQLQLAVSTDHHGPVNGLALSEKDCLLISVGDDSLCRIHRYDNPGLEDFSMEGLRSFEHHTEEINGCSLDNDAQKLLTYGYDCKAVITDMETGIPIWSYTTEDVITAGHISPNGQLVALAINGGCDLIIADTSVDKETQILPAFHSGKTIMHTRWSPNTSRLASCGTDSLCRLYDLRSSKATLVLKGHSNAISQAVFSQNEHWLITASWDKTVAMWNLSTGSFRTEGPGSFGRGHNSSVSCCSVKPDGSQVASGSYDKTVLVWDSESGTVSASLQGCTDWVQDVEITADGEVVFAASRDGTVRALSVERAADSRIHAAGRRALGVTVVRCLTCGKPYSIGDTTELDNVEMRFCVFCRLVRREKKQFLMDAKLQAQRKTTEAIS